jgi:hypothetical protein
MGGGPAIFFPHLPSRLSLSFSQNNEKMRRVGVTPASGAETAPYANFSKPSTMGLGRTRKL